MAEERRVGYAQQCVYTQHYVYGIREEIGDLRSSKGCAHICVIRSAICVRNTPSTVCFVIMATRTDVREV